MKTAKTKASTRANLPATVVEHVQQDAPTKAWARDITAAIKAAESKGRAILELVIKARDAGLPETFVRETVRAAYLQAGSSKESARKRASDAITVFQSATPASDLPRNVQEAAAKVRKEKAGQRAPRHEPAGSKDKPQPDVDVQGHKRGKAAPDSEQLRELSPLELIELGVKAIQKSSNDLGVLSIVTEILDLAQDLAVAMAKPAGSNKKAA